MKLYIKQKVFSWRDKFAVWDEQQHDRWFAQGKVFSWGRKLQIFDEQGREAAFIRQKIMTLMPKYFIEIEGVTYTLAKELTLLKPRFRLENADWTISGNFLGHEYEVLNGSEQVMSLSRQWLSWGDSYELDIPRPENELLCLCVALAIDCVHADAAGASSASISGN
ncbi:hypothetical protein FACS1894217_00770 [Clostridia bacterium]|nr:hypothetical protein FACS1894217_00770 [Clostridia bacterium]